MPAGGASRKIMVVSSSSLRHNPLRFMATEPNLTPQAQLRIPRKSIKRIPHHFRRRLFLKSFTQFSFLSPALRANHKQPNLRIEKRFDLNSSRF